MFAHISNKHLWSFKIYFIYQVTVNVIYHEFLIEFSFIINWNQKIFKLLNSFTKLKFHSLFKKLWAKCGHLKSSIQSEKVFNEFPYANCFPLDGYLKSASENFLEHLKLLGFSELHWIIYESTAKIFEIGLYESVLFLLLKKKSFWIY